MATKSSKSKTYYSFMRPHLVIRYSDGHKSIVFQDGRFSTDDPEAQEALESHQRYGVSIMDEAAYRKRLKVVVDNAVGSEGTDSIEDVIGEPIAGEQ